MSSGLFLRPRPLDADSRVKPYAGASWVLDPDSGKGEASSEKGPVVSAVDSVAGSYEAVSAAPSGQVADSSPAKSLLQCGFLRPMSSSLPEKEAVLALGSIESSSIGEVSSAWVFEKGKVATCHLSPNEGMLRRGFLLRRSFGEVTESRRLCSLEEQLPSSGSDKATLGMDLDPVLDLGLGLDPGLDPVLIASQTSLVAIVSLVIQAPILTVASVSRVKQFSFPPVLEDALMNSAHAKASFVSKSSLGLQREAI
jgi:hypothetical protein